MFEMMVSDEKRAKLEAKFRRGEEAKRILAEPILAETFLALEADIIKTMKYLKPNDKEGVDVCFRELRSLERLKQKLHDYVTYGEHAKTSLFSKK